MTREKQKRGSGYVLLAAVLLVAVCIGWCISQQVWPMAGRCVIADNGSCLLVRGDGPVCLSNREKALSEGLETGDRILGLISGGIAESYPAQAGARTVIRLGGGGPEDISPEVLKELEELGWWTSPE